MVDTFKKCWALLPPRLRWAALGLLVLVHVHAVAQLAMVTSILPFLQVISNPERIDDGRFWRTLREFMGPVDDTTLLLIAGSAVIAAVFVANLLRTAHSILAARFAFNLNSSLSSRLFRSYLSHPYPFYINKNSSEFLRNIFSEVDLVTGGFVHTTMDAISRTITIVALGALLLFVNPWITLGAGLFFAGSYGGIYYILRRRLIQAAERRTDADGLRYKAVSEAFGTIKELKVLRREGNFLQAFEKSSRRYFRYQERAHLYSALPRNLVETVAFAGMVAIALAILQQYGRFTDALPILGLFAVAGYRLFPAIQGLYRCCSQLRYYRKSVEIVHHECGAMLTTDRATEIPFIRDTSEVSEPSPMKLRDSIELRDVSFSYPGANQQALAGINLRIPARKRIGLCGKSGAGKTTLADIVLGLLAPQEGAMLVDGVQVHESNRIDWQRNCGYVPQQIYLIDDTIRKNIAFGIPVESIDDDRVKAAAQLANLHGFIENKLADGYDTDVGEDGIRLSGGQRQRIGIARALYHDPDVIVLDEATSSLDSETEQAIVDAVQSLSGHKTVLMIAHRLSTIRQSDFIVFLDEGRIEEIGTFDEIFIQNERFRRLAAPS